MAVSLLIALAWGLLWTLLGLIGLLALLLLLLLFLPLDLHLRADSDLAAPDWEADLEGAIRWLLRLRWGWVLFRGEWEGESFEIKRSAVRFLGIRPRSRRRAEARKAKKPRKKRGITPELLRAYMAYAEEFARFLARSVRDLGVRFAGQVTYGFADPALTGWCEGIRWSVHLPIPIELEPSFNRPCLTGWTEANGRTYGYRVAAAALRALRNPVIRKHLAERIHFKPVKYVLQRGG